MRKEPKEQFELFDYDETHGISYESILKVFKDLNSNKKIDGSLGVENDPSFCDPVCLWEN